MNSFRHVGLVPVDRSKALAAAAKETPRVTDGTMAATFFVEESLSDLYAAMSKKSAMDRERSARKRRGSVTEYSLELTDAQNQSMLTLDKLHTHLKGLKVDDLAIAMVTELKMRKKDLYNGARRKTKAELLRICCQKVEAEKAKITERSGHRHSNRKRK